MQEMIYLKNGWVVPKELYDAVMYAAAAFQKSNNFPILIEIALTHVNPNSKVTQEAQLAARRFDWMIGTKIWPEVAAIINEAVVQKGPDYIWVDPKFDQPKVVLRDGSLIPNEVAKDFFELTKLMVKQKLLISYVKSIKDNNTLSSHEKNFLLFVSSFVLEEHSQIRVISPFRGLTVNKPLVID